MKSTAITAALFAALTVTGMTGCTESVNPGYEGVVIDKPYFFGNEGVRPKAQMEGREWYWWSTSVKPYENRPIRHDEDFKDLFAKDNVPVSLDAGVELRLIKGESPKMHEKFGDNFYHSKVSLKFRNLVRDFARGKTSSELTSGENSIQAGQEAIKDALQTYVTEQELPLVVENVFIGKATPPNEVLTEIANTASQRQRKKTESERKGAEDSRKDAEESKALADKAYMTKFGMNIEQYLRLRDLELEKEKIEMVKDKENVSILMSSGPATPQPMYKIKQ
ncbi:Band 7 domain-containing protein [Vibrio crassostreae]|nr:PHB domain-containing protein [Vibrio chagasii]CAK2874201.1 Band 7 domain-containing protein [Vibrio crassostreae]